MIREEINLAAVAAVWSWWKAVFFCNGATVESASKRVVLIRRLWKRSTFGPAISVVLMFEWRFVCNMIPNFLLVQCKLEWYFLGWHALQKHIDVVPAGYRDAYFEIPKGTKRTHMEPAPPPKKKNKTTPKSAFKMLPSLKLTWQFSPKNGGFQVRNLQTSRGSPFSNTNWRGPLPIWYINFQWKQLLPVLKPLVEWRKNWSAMAGFLAGRYQVYPWGCGWRWMTDGWYESLALQSLLQVVFGVGFGYLNTEPHNVFGALGSISSSYCCVCCGTQGLASNFM